MQTIQQYNNFTYSIQMLHRIYYTPNSKIKSFLNMGMYLNTLTQLFHSHCTKHFTTKRN
jgi:hypothetical protein